MRAIAEDVDGHDAIARLATSMDGAADVDVGPFTWITILSTSRGDVHERVTQPDTTPATIHSTPELRELDDDDAVARDLGVPMAKGERVGIGSLNKVGTIWTKAK